MHLLESHSIAVTTHGRYLTRPGAAGAPILVGFHGYAESADVQMERLATIPGIADWTLASVQGLHRFYRRRSDEVVASWMTRQDRELMIADNVAYVSAVLDQLCPAAACRSPVVFGGFSQGVAMAFRAGVLGPRRVAALVALGGDVPPELDADALRRVPSVVIGRGRADPSYTEEMFDRDVARLTAAGVPTHRVVVDARHEWTPEFAATVGAYLETVR